MKEYRVSEPFNILDIYKARPKSIKKYRTKEQRCFEEFFENLLGECTFLFGTFGTFCDIEDVQGEMMGNLPLLEQLGFIEEIQDIELKPGMQIQKNGDKILVTQGQEFVVIKTGRKLKYAGKAKTLMELNNNYRVCKEPFEVINE